MWARPLRAASMIMTYDMRLGKRNRIEMLMDSSEGDVWE
jgi:hypothetical protein